MWMWCEGECGVGDDGVDEGSVAVTPVTAGRLTCALHSPTSDTRALRRQKNKKKEKPKHIKYSQIWRHKQKQKHCHTTIKRLRLECNAVPWHSGHKETSAGERLLRVAKHKPIAKGERGPNGWLHAAYSGEEASLLRLWDSSWHTKRWRNQFSLILFGWVEFSCSLLSRRRAHTKKFRQPKTD